jgi:TolB protein
MFTKTFRILSVGAVLLVMAITGLTTINHVQAQDNTANGEIFYLTGNGNRAIGENTNLLTYMVMNADGTNPRSIGSYLASWIISDVKTAWSPDGTMLAVSVCTLDSPRDDICGIRVQKYDGTRVTNTLEGRSQRYPAWSPDSKRILYEGYDSSKETAWQVYSMNPDGSDVIELTSGGSTRNTPNSSPTWSPDGKHILFTTMENFELFTNIMDPDGSNVRRLPNYSGYYYRWSSQGKVAFQRSGPEDGISGWYLYVMNSDGSNLRKVMESGNTVMFSWSPDGTQLVFVSCPADRFQDPDIYVENADGTNLRKLTDTKADRAPAWSLDGKKIVFISARSGTDQIYVMNADGTDQHSLTNDKYEKSNPSWIPNRRK